MVAAAAAGGSKRRWVKVYPPPLYHRIHRVTAKPHFAQAYLTPSPSLAPPHTLRYTLLRTPPTPSPRMSSPAPAPAAEPSAPALRTTLDGLTRVVTPADRGYEFAAYQYVTSTVGTDGRCVPLPGTTGLWAVAGSGAGCIAQLVGAGGPRALAPPQVAGALSRWWLRARPRRAAWWGRGATTALLQRLLPIARVSDFALALTRASRHLPAVRGCSLRLLRDHPPAKHTT